MSKVATPVGSVENLKPEEKSPEKVSSENEDETEYPNGRTVAAVMTALYLAMFLVALVIPPHPFHSNLYTNNH